jgi:hypothetical protein
MQYKEILSAGSEKHARNINTPSRQNARFLNVEPVAAYSNHSNLKGKT